ncbi:MAG: hypothetical protein V1908_00255, partial [Candidatus Peregrinibacteria bacterium]
IGYIQSKKQVSLKELIAHFEFSQQAVSKQLKKLVMQGVLGKAGRPPKVFYFFVEPKEVISHETIDPKFKKIIQERFLLITPIGEMKSGVAGFTKWCAERDLPIAKTAIEYARTLKKYDAFRHDGLIDGMGKMRRTFSAVNLDHLHYLDFYSIERFGKTKLGQMLLYSKQSQNRGFMKELIHLIKPAIERLIKRYKIDAVGFIPPTVKREVQFMKELQKYLNLKAHAISIVKVKTPIIVPQKTLAKLEDRVENAQKTIIVDEVKKYSHILLIDDAVGSGATMKEVAAQIKFRHLAKTVTGLAITGSFKGFDVISEV